MPVNRPSVIECRKSGIPKDPVRPFKSSQVLFYSSEPLVLMGKDLTTTVQMCLSAMPPHDAILTCISVLLREQLITPETAMTIRGKGILLGSVKRVGGRAPKLKKLP